MHQDSSQNNRRIAINTLLLYFRMLVLMFIGLFTSRIVLNTLGIVDYGIQNAVGGFIAIFSFLQGSIGGAASRYITFDLGKGDMLGLKRTFRNILTIHVLLAVLLLILAETIGLWFVLKEMKFPEDRTVAAFFVYQFSVFSAVMSLFCVPFNSVIIAHEKMAAFAYITILDAVFKLLIVVALVYVPFDKLITYSWMIMFVQVVDGIIYITYCRRHFIETRTGLGIEKKQFKEIAVYAIWILNGNIAVAGYTQGLNILLNLFFGPAVNAARGVAVQIQNICNQFCSNFQMALNPQITKSYAQGNMDGMHSLLLKSSKFSFFIMLLLALPICIEADFILHIWLGLVPEYTVAFTRLILITSLLYTLSNPIIISVHATGRLKRFQLVEGTILLTIVPVAYILLKYVILHPMIVFIVHIVIEILAQFFRIQIVLPMIGMPKKKYVIDVLVPIIKVLIVGCIPPIIISLFLSEGLLSFIIEIFLSLFFLLIAIYYLGSLQREREMYKNVIFRTLVRISSCCGSAFK